MAYDHYDNSLEDGNDIKKKKKYDIARFVREIDFVLNDAVDKLSEKEFLELCMDVKDSCDIRLNGEHKIKYKMKAQPFEKRIPCCPVCGQAIEGDLKTQPLELIKEKNQEIETLKRFSSLYEQTAIERDGYKALILKAFEWASPLSKKGKIYKIKLRMFEKEHNIDL